MPLTAVLDEGDKELFRVSAPAREKLSGWLDYTPIVIPRSKPTGMIATAAQKGIIITKSLSDPTRS
jgi:hypothetical protein